MTMPNVPSNPEELPPPELKLLVTDNLDPENSAKKGERAHWIVGQPHPFMPSMQVEAMFVSRNAVAVYVYSSSRKSQFGARDVIPMSRVHLAHERMALEVLAEEVNASAAGDDPYVYEDRDDAVDDDETPEEAPTADVPANGQTSP